MSYWDERDKIANEVEDIVVTLVGATKANTFVSDEMFTKIITEQQSAHKSETRRRKQTRLVILLSAAILTPLVLFLLAWIMGEV